MVVQIKWGDSVKNAYNHGSRVTFVKNGVIFDNPMMSPSFPIISWSSRSNFQGDRSQPALPLLNRGKTYRLVLEAEVTPAGSAYIKVTYFDRLGEELSFDVLKDDHWLFTYPFGAAFYKVELINAGCEHLFFDRLLLLESSQELRGAVDLTGLDVYFPKETHQLNVIFLEEDILTVYDLPTDVLKSLGNVVLVGNRQNAQQLYLSREFEQELIRRLWFYYEQGLTAINLIGYGVVSNLAALYYGTKFDSQVYINSLLESQSYYQKQLASRQVDSEVSLSHLFERLDYSTTIHRYGLGLEQNGFDLIRGTFQIKNQLQELPSLILGKN